MPSLNDFLRERTNLESTDVEWLRLLVGDWQLWSDLGFADLVLWVSTAQGWLAVAHVRANTGPTVFLDDVVGTIADGPTRPMIERAYTTGVICDESPQDPPAAVPSREQAIPVIRQGRHIAVVSRHTALTVTSTPSPLEQHYLEASASLSQMVAEGRFPQHGAVTGSRRGAPRVGDGLIVLDTEGYIRYASPNAISAYHRFGYDLPLVGYALAELTTPLLRGGAAIDEGLPLVLVGKAPFRADVESATATLSVRAVPLSRGGHRSGALLVLRDVSELRRRERELLSKDATIREIHHRVKNNLQTVAALLRLQARRVSDGEAGKALRQAERRVAAIAWVHETLSTGYDETVDFGDIATSGLSTIVEVARPAGAIRTTYDGRFGRIRGEDATALSLILTELIQNASEHGLAGRDGYITVMARREFEGDPGRDRLQVTVRDNGVGLLGDPESPLKATAEPNGLGGQIVRALVEELRGTISWDSPADGGTAVTVDLRPRPLA